MAIDQRISGCRLERSVCVSDRGREDFGLVGIRRQSLQIRRLDGRGNPIVGAVSAWR